MKGEFERLIHGIYFESDRLKELQQKTAKKGLRGDEVFEFIYLDRKELSDRLEKAKALLSDCTCNDYPHPLVQDFLKSESLIKSNNCQHSNTNKENK